DDLRLPMAAFVDAPGDLFDLSAVTGIRISVETVTATPGDWFAIPGIRAVTSSWSDRRNDMDTQIEALVNPVAPDGSDATGEPNVMIRGTGTCYAPLPLDPALTAVCNGGCTRSDRRDVTATRHGDWVSGTAYGVTSTIAPGGDRA